MPSSAEPTPDPLVGHFRHGFAALLDMAIASGLDVEDVWDGIAEVVNERHAAVSESDAVRLATIRDMHSDNPPDVDVVPVTIDRRGGPSIRLLVDEQTARVLTRPGARIEVPR